MIKLKQDYIRASQDSLSDESLAERLCEIWDVMPIENLFNLFLVHRPDTRLTRSDIVRIDKSKKRIVEKILTEEERKKINASRNRSEYRTRRYSKTKILERSQRLGVYKSGNHWKMQWIGINGISVKSLHDTCEDAMWAYDMLEMQRIPSQYRVLNFRFDHPD